MSSIHTLNHAIRSLYSTPDSFLSYTQRLDIRNLYADLSYSTYLLHRPEHETLTLTFPRECKLVSHLTNNYACKMVYYKTIDGFIQEFPIHSHTVIEVDSHTSITIYTRSKPDLTITFNMVLIKPSLRSHL